ncbi:MAG: nucleoside recognition domain-containing protein [Rhodothermus sp.]|nr:nucleoside recognition domain-containing protein [Rhodothermus sp.]
MLNYIWAGLIIFSLVFAVASDVRDLVRDTYRNGDPLPVTLVFPEGYRPEVRRQPVVVQIDSATFRAFYRTETTPAPAYTGELVQFRSGRELRFASEVDLPEPLATIRQVTSPRANELRGTLHTLTFRSDSLATAALVFAPVRFVRLQAITDAAFEFARTAVTLALGLIGLLALWLGLLRIAETAGLVQHLARWTQPLLRPLFPDVPRDHPAFALITLNLTANMLGLGNAATPLGIKAMEALQKLNPRPDTATNAMVMLLAMNTASVQLVPPVLLMAIMGAAINELILPIILVTLTSLVVAIIAAKLLARLPAYRHPEPQQATTDHHPQPKTDA